MSGNQTCAVHTLVEQIRNGTVQVKPYDYNLAWLESSKPHVTDPLHWHLIDVREDGEAIARAHKFDFSTWPQQTTALSDVLYATGIDMINSQIATLPYPEVVFCHHVQTPVGSLDEVLLIREHRGSGPTVISFRTYNKFRDGPEEFPWFFSGYTAQYRYAAATEWLVDWIASPANALPPELYKRWPDFENQYVANHACFFLSALAALSSRGPEIHTQPAPEKLNKQRAKKGKLPIFEYRVVEIPAWAKEKAEGLGGTHASPRLHWRRGHERRLGEDRKTFVHACLVGAAENGFIHKDYAVAPPPKPNP